MVGKSSKKSEKPKQDMQDIPEMQLDPKYFPEKAKVPEQPKEAEIKKIKKEVEKIKDFIVKKYSYVKSVSILPAQALKFFIEEEIGDDVPKAQLEKLQKKIHLYVIIPDEKRKEILKIKQEIIRYVDKTKQDIWLYVKTSEDVWETALDSKFELMSAIALSFPIYDKGILGALRVAEIHKSLVLQKFDKYVVSYVIGGSLVRGDAIKTSDVDVFVVINDTDVKRMPRIELKERLRSMIYQYVAQAVSLAGVKNSLEPQIYLLTEFWEAVKDAHPVMFTFIRDGVPLYDKGTFMPWKALLKMGKLKPSPEAIDMFMSMGDKTVSRAKKALLDIMVHEVYWSILTPSQALLMLYGRAPPTPKQTPSEIKKVFYEKEKMLEKKYVNILEKIVKVYKDYEHEKIKEIKGVQIDKFLKDTEDYLKRLKELREQIEKQAQKKTVEQIYEDVFELLETLVGKKSREKMIEDFEKDYVKKGKFSPQDLRILRNIVSARKEFKAGKLNSHKVNEARKKGSILINDLVDYNQRCELAKKK